MRSTQRLFPIVLVLSILVWVAPASAGRSQSTDKDDASAEEGQKVEVGHFSSYEFREISLKKGETADLMVFLSSQGEMVEGYKISLVRERTRRVVKTVVSGTHGVVTFPNLRPDKYTIVLRRTNRQRKTSSVAIGDFRLKKSEESEAAYFE